MTFDLLGRCPEIKQYVIPTWSCDSSSGGWHRVRTINKALRKFFYSFKKKNVKILHLLVLVLLWCHWLASMLLTCLTDWRDQLLQSLCCFYFYSEVGLIMWPKQAQLVLVFLVTLKKCSSGSGSLRKQNSAAEISSIRHHDPLPVWQEMFEFSLVSNNQQVWTGTNVHRYSRWHVLPGCEEEDAADGKVGQQHEEPNGWREWVQEGEVSWFTALKHRQTKSQHYGFQYQIWFLLLAPCESFPRKHEGH